MFNVGEKIVCIDNGGSAATLLTLNAVYTVTKTKHRRSFYVQDEHQCRVGDGLKLREVLIHEFDWFNVERFRRYVERKTDIAVFQALLKKRELEHS